MRPSHQWPDMGREMTGELNRCVEFLRFAASRPVQRSIFCKIRGPIVIASRYCVWLKSYMTPKIDHRPTNVNYIQQPIYLRLQQKVVLW